VYTTTYTMRDPNGKTVKDMFPPLFKEDDENEHPDHITPEEQKEMEQMLHDFKW
jgi:hypothetical protein